MRKLNTIIFSLFLLSCGNNQQQSPTPKEIANAEPVEVKTEDDRERAYFASGCFWCVEAIYESIVGVEEAISGYAGGHTKNPTYEETNTERTGHAETVEVIYNPDKIDFETLVRVFFESQDPVQKGGQGPDIGSQYRSIAFYQNEEQKNIIEEIKAETAKNYDKPLAVEVLPFQKFWKAEDYHQDYKEKNPNNPYIKNVSDPRLKRFKQKFPELLKENQN